MIITRSHYYGSAISLMIFIIILLGLGSVEKCYAIISSNSDIIVNAEERVNSAVAFGHDISIHGTVEEDAVSFGGNLHIHPGAVIMGDAVTFGGTLTAEENSHIHGDLVVIGGKSELANGSSVDGERVDFGFPASSLFWVLLWPLGGLLATFGFLFVIGIHVIRILLFVGIAVLITYFFPTSVIRISSANEKNFWLSLLVGFAILVLLPFFLILLFITIIGIPLVPLSIMVFFIIGLLGSAGVSLALGNRLPEAANRDPLVNVVLGSLLISILQSIPIIGVLTWLLLGALSFGSVAITRGGRQHHKPIMQQESLPPE